MSSDPRADLHLRASRAQLTPTKSVHRSKHLGDGPDDARDLFGINDQRRRKRDDVSGHADQQAALKTSREHVVATRAWRAVARGQFDPADQPNRSDIDDMGQC